MRIDDMKQHQLHIPVLLESVLAVLEPKLGDSYLDLTAGMGGHARAILARTKAACEAVLVDRDKFAISNLDDLGKSGVQLIHSDFLQACQKLTGQGRQFDLILIDLGVSSPQLDQAERGFSFSKPARLDMRMDQSAPISAHEVVNTYPARKLSQVFQDFGEDSPKRATAIAGAIVKNRPLDTTTELANLIGSISKRRGKINPATKIFQAIRIEVNQELMQLTSTLEMLPKLLGPGGRLAIISFHSLEDRLVKRFLKEQFDQGLASQFVPISAKPIFGAINDDSNPRSRSAVLRGAVKK